MEQNILQPVLNAFTRDEILCKFKHSGFIQEPLQKLKYLGSIQEPLQEFNIQGSSKNFFKDQPILSCK